MWDDDWNWAKGKQNEGERGHEIPLETDMYMHDNATINAPVNAFSLLSFWFGTG